MLQNCSKFFLEASVAPSNGLSKSRYVSTTAVASACFSVSNDFCVGGVPSILTFSEAFSMSGVGIFAKFLMNLQ